MGNPNPDPALPPRPCSFPACVCACPYLCVFRWPTWCKWRVTACQAPSLCTTPTACPLPQRRCPPPGLPCPGRTPTPPPTPLLPHPCPAWRPPLTSWTAAPGCGRMTICRLRSLHVTISVFLSECVCVCAWHFLLFFQNSVLGILIRFLLSVWFLFVISELKMCCHHIVLILIQNNYRDNLERQLHFSLQCSLLKVFKVLNLQQLNVTWWMFCTAFILNTNLVTQPKLSEVVRSQVASFKYFELLKLIKFE